MTMNTAYRLAHDWALWFQCAFFIVELGPDLYGVAARVSTQDRVVAKVDAA